MKKRILLLTMIMCLLGGINSVMAQDVVTIDGTVGNYTTNTTTSNVPIRTFNSRSYGQQIYYKGEINKDNGSVITNIAFYVSSNVTEFPYTRNVKVYLTNTEKETYSSTEMVKLSSEDLVYDAGLTFESTGWINIPLNKEFTYTGNNIMVSVWDNTGSYIENTFFSSFTAKDDDDNRRCAYKINNSANPVNSTIYGSLSKDVPQIKFTFASNSGGGDDPAAEPDAPALTSPANGAEGIFNPSLNFTLGNHTEDYQILMGEGANEMTSVTGWVEKTNNTVSYQTNNLKSNTAYSWKVVARCSDGGTGYLTTGSEVYTFTTKEFAAPDAISGITPANGAEVYSDPQLSWTFGENTESYKVLFAREGEDLVIAKDWTNTKNAEDETFNTSAIKLDGEYDDPGLDANTTYQWQIVTKNSVGETPSDVFTFTKLGAPDNVTPISPANGATNVSSNVIRWQFADNTTEYRILTNDGSGFTYVKECKGGIWMETEGATTASYDLGQLTPNKTYEWCIDVKNDAGQRTVWNGGDEISTFSFTTASVLNTTYKSPENGATNIANAKLTWNYNGTPDYYQVLMGTAENELVAKTEWLAAEGTGGTFQTENLNNATQYYWQVNIKNGETVMEGEKWSFVTTLPAPTNVAANPAQIVPTLSMTYGSTTISWDDMGATGYNVYLGETKLNAELITATSYEIADNTMKLSYNMEPGHDIYVQAIYAIGESNMSEAVYVKVTGFGYFESTIYSNDWYTRLAGATVTLTCTADEFGNEYDGNGRVYTFTTNSNGEVFETIEMPNDETVTNTSLKLYNGTYSVLVEKEYHDSFEGSVVISNIQTTEFNKILNPDNTYIFEVRPFNGTFESIDVYIVDASEGHYHVYLKEGEIINDLGMQYFTKDNNSAYFEYAGWADLNNGDYQFGVAKANDCINWSEIVTRDYNIFETDGNLSDVNNWRDGLPEVGEDIYINANAVIEAGENLAYGDVTIKGSLTINGKLTADMVNNAAFDKLCINDGGQLRQTKNAELSGKFVKSINAPTNWEATSNVDGWQFISAPVADRAISAFVSGNVNYDLFKYDGTKEGAEWVNYQGHVADFEETFQQGRGYLASYQEEGTFTFSGELNNDTTFNFVLTAFNDTKEWSKFTLLGNPFTFNMNIANLVGTGMEAGVAVINGTGNGYSYMTDGEVKVGEGFFVKANSGTAMLSYEEGPKQRGEENVPSINLIATSKAGNDNVIIRFADEENEGFNKLDNFDRSIAEIYVGNRYAIMSYDENTTEVEVKFHANEMGNYTIAAVPSGKFQTLTLVDRFTGIETNLLVEDYHFTATSSEDVNRFIVKLAVSGQQSAVSDNFVYQSGEELIVDAEGRVQIIDVMGRVVYSNDVESTNNRIDVSGFRNGTYMVRVINETEVKVEKVVIY